jgi:hypothetical protein
MKKGKVKKIKYSYTPIAYQIKQFNSEISIHLDWLEKNGGDIGDLGNFIGIVVGKCSKDELSDFMNGFNHGVSLQDGTH